MKTINLKDYYDHITTDTLIEVPDKVFDVFEEQRKAEQPIRVSCIITMQTIR